MRRIILGTALGLIFSFGAFAAVDAGNGYCEESDPCGGWVKINADGLVISGAMVCTSSVCGDSNSVFSRMTLNAGEQYVQQTQADPVTGNVVGIGNNNPGTTVTYDRPSETFTVVFPEPAPAPTASAPAPTEVAPQPSNPVAPSPEATSVPPTTGPTQASPTPTPGAEPTQVSPRPTVVTEPTTEPTRVPVAVPTVDPSVIPNTYEFKLSDTVDGNINWNPKRRPRFGEHLPI